MKTKKVVRIEYRYEYSSAYKIGFMTNDIYAEEKENIDYTDHKKLVKRIKKYLKENADINFNKITINFKTVEILKVDRTIELEEI